MKPEIKITADGSPTLYLAAMDEHYHSTFGAIQESQHVFIRAGFDLCPGNDIRVLEIGFGTGLNCCLTLLAAIGSGKTVHYCTLEKYPLPAGIWQQLDYDAQLPAAGSGLFSSLHQAGWNKKIAIAPGFFLQKIEADLLQFDFAAMPTFDLVYFDAFSPEKQPELWEQPVFERICAAMNEGGIVVTYCAKGAVRRAMQAAGMAVERIPGPPGKREMIRARKL